MLEITREGDTMTFWWTGQLVEGNRQELKDEFVGRIPEGAIFIIDFGGCGHIDSSGLGVLVALHKLVEEAGGKLQLRPNEDLRIMFQLTRLDTVLNIVS